MRNSWSISDIFRAHARILTGIGIITSCFFALPCAGLAQGFIDDPDWKEFEVPPPPPFNKDKLIAIDMPAYVSLKFGVDPATLVITRDGVVRYVMVAINETGSVNAMYEGIRCASGEFKTYARYSSSGQWSLVKDPQWRALNDNNTPKHALALARSGACSARSTAADSAADVIELLKSNPYSRIHR